MNSAIVALRSERGDAPGYLREGLRALAGFADVTANSDLYRLLRPTGSSDGYLMLAELTAELPLGDLRTCCSRAAPAGSLEVEPIAYAGRVVSGGILGAPEITALADFAPGCEFPGGTPLASRARDLTQTERAAVRRIEGTAVLGPRRWLDYDTGGAAGYDEVRPLSRFDRDLFERALAEMHYARGMRVLDIGCGTGRFTELLSQAGARVTGVDSSEQMLALARAKAVTARQAITYVGADANTWLPAGPFEAATFFFSIQYIAFEGEIWRLLSDAVRPGGRVVIATLSHRHFVETYLSEFFPSIPRIDLARFPSLPKLARVLEERGMAGVRVRSFDDEDTTPPEALLHRVSQKFVSSLRLISAAEFDAGLEAMRSALHGMAQVRRVLRGAIVSARMAG